MNLISRARDILRTPRSEWPVIAVERASISGLYADYVGILAAVPLIAQLAHLLAAGLPLRAAGAIALSAYLMAFVNVAVVAFVSARLAPRFGGVGDLGQAFKLAAYGHTAAWLGGIFLLLPWLGPVLQLASALYSAYIFYLGIPELMRVPPRRSLAFFLVVLALTILIAIFVTAALGLATGFSHLLFLR